MIDSQGISQSNLLPPDDWQWEKTVPLTAEACARQAAEEAARLQLVVDRVGLDARTSPGERARGYVRPLRITVKHQRSAEHMQACGGSFALALHVAQALATDPASWPRLHCRMCSALDQAEAYRWIDGRVVGS